MASYQEIELLLQVGEYRQAGSLVGEWADAEPKTVLRDASSDAERLRTAAVVADVLFHVGNLDGGRRWVTESNLHDEWSTTGIDLPARTRLLAAEYYYSLRKFHKAIGVAKQVRDRCREKGDRPGEAEASHARARCEMRLHSTPARIFEHCDQALHSLSLADVPPLARQWRTGRILLISGFTAAKGGHPTWSDLFVAKTLLAGTGDVVARGAVDHAIATALRSRGRDADEALACFEAALKAYTEMGHRPNVCRLHVDRGRMFLNRGARTDARKEFDAALEQVAMLTDEQASKRLQAECLVWYSRLRLEQSVPLDQSVLDAQRDAQQALQLVGWLHAHAKTAPGELAAEAHLAMAECHSALQELPSARRHLTEALTIARDRNIRILIANAHLGLARLDVEQETAAAALSHYLLALRELDASSTRFVLDKADDIKQRIESMQQVWVVTRSKIEKPGGLLQEMKRLERWGVERLEEVLKGKSLKDKGIKAGFTGPGYLKKMRRVMKSVPDSPATELPSVPRKSPE